MVSHYENQGTVSPSSYNIIYDSLNLAPGNVQAFTFRMCHMYFNWNGTIRVPAVCQYAHKLAYLSGEFLHRSPNMNLNNRLHFL